MTRRRTLLGAIALLALSACAAFSTRSSLPDFDLLGRVFVGYEGPSFSSNLRWNHVGGEDQIWLMTPLGQTLAYIEDRPTGASLTSANQQQYYAASVEGLTKSALGWALPLEQLRYWVRGEQVPRVPSADVQRTADGQLLELTQAGWKITFTPAPQHASLHLPQRLQLSNGSQQIRLVIDEWRPVTPSP